MGDILTRIMHGEGIYMDMPPSSFIDALQLDMKAAAGWATHFNNHNWIFINDKLTGYNKAYVIAHEIGHILMGHVGPGSHFYWEGKELSPWAERDAGTFASTMLALMLFDKYREDAPNA